MGHVIRAIWNGIVRLVSADPVFGAHGRCAI
jgi:hypothetical protein